MDTSTPFRLGYRPALDGLRGVAIAAVLTFHSEAFFLVGGFIGVDLFFVVSGFLITTLLVQERRTNGRVDLLGFYARRALRLTPAVLGLLAALWAAVLVFGDRFSTGPVLMAKATAATLLYMANWVLAIGLLDGWPAALGHLWSLAIEEQFYLVWPLILIGCLSTRHPFRTALLVSLSLAAASALWRANLTLEGASFGRRYFGTDTRADGILLGCALGLVVTYKGLPVERVRRAALVFGGLVLTVALFVANNGANAMHIWGFAVVSVAAAALVLGTVEPPRAIERVLTWRPLVQLGRISYGLYLWHGVIYYLLHHTASVMVLPTPVLGVLEVGLSLIAAVGSYIVIERPALRLKKRFSPRPERTQPPTALAA